MQGNFMQQLNKYFKLPALTQVFVLWLVSSGQVKNMIIS